MASFSVLPLEATRAPAGLERASAILPIILRAATSAVPHAPLASRRTTALLTAWAEDCTAVDPLALAARQGFAILQAAPVSAANSV